jgi:hypothetical protein
LSLFDGESIFFGGLEKFSNFLDFVDSFHEVHIISLPLSSPSFRFLYPTCIFHHGWHLVCACMNHLFLLTFESLLFLSFIQLFLRLVLFEKHMANFIVDDWLNFSDTNFSFSVYCKKLRDAWLHYRLHSVGLSLDWWWDADFLLHDWMMLMVE